MSESTPALYGVSLAIELVNTVDMLNDPPDFLTDLDRLRRFLRYVGHEAATKGLTESDLNNLRSVRYDITIAIDQPAPASAAKRLNRLAETLDMRPRVESTGERSWDIRYGHSPRQGPSFIGPSAVMGLLQLIVNEEWDRIGRCAGAPCCCIFVDRSRNRSRHFCSQLCADRVNQASKRRRMRDADRARQRR